MSEYSSFFASPLTMLAMLWALAWKGLALWRSSRDGRKIWFIALLVINTLGILEIIYLFFFDKKFKSEAGCYLRGGCKGGDCKTGCNDACCAKPEEKKPEAKPTETPENKA